MFIRYSYFNDSNKISPIDTKYGELGGYKSLLGPPIGPEQSTPDGRGHYRPFRCGNIYWSPTRGAHVVSGVILLEYENLGGTKSALGFPITDQTSLVGVTGGAVSHFKGGTITYEPGKGINVSYNIRRLYRASAIDIKYAELGGSTPGSKNPLGNPIGPEKPTHDKRGRSRRYQHGIITSLKETGTHAIWGPVFDKWWGMKEISLGYPLTDVINDGILGSFANFQYGHIYYTLAMQAHEVHGLILEKYKQLGAHKSILGYPASDETTASDGEGKYNLFTFGRIYWSPRTGTGAWEIYGPILIKYISLGAEKSFLGYPTSGVLPAPGAIGGLYQTFQGGNIYFSPRTDAREVHGLILQEYLKLGATTSKLGFPISDELGQGTPSKMSTFDNGYITYEDGKGIKVGYR